MSESRSAFGCRLASGVNEEVGEMRFDPKIITGIVIGMVLGLQYHEALVLYMPLLVIAGLVMLLKVLHR